VQLQFFLEITRQFVKQWVTLRMQEVPLLLACCSCVASTKSFPLQAAPCTYQ
jgi:hypothetical protein